MEIRKKFNCFRCAVHENERDVPSKSAEPGRSIKIKKTFKTFKLMPKFVKQVHTSFESSTKPSVYSLCSGSPRVRNFIFIEKSSTKSFKPNLKQKKTLSSINLSRPTSSKPKGSVKSLNSLKLVKKSLQYKPSKANLPFASKPHQRAYQFSFDLENGIMRSVSVLCKL